MNGAATRHGLLVVPRTWSAAQGGIGRLLRGLREQSRTGHVHRSQLEAQSRTSGSPDYLPLALDHPCGMAPQTPVLTPRSSRCGPVSRSPRRPSTEHAHSTPRRIRSMTGPSILSPRTPTAARLPYAGRTDGDGQESIWFQSLRGEQRSPTAVELLGDILSLSGRSILSLSPPPPSSPFPPLAPLPLSFL